MRTKNWQTLLAAGLLCLGGLSEALAADKLLCFGDSITAGYKKNRAVAYPTYLKLSSVTVVNEGKGGENTVQGVARIKSALAKHQPKYAAIMEGANDIVQGISPATTSYNLKRMAELAKAAGASPVLSTITPNSDSRYVPQNYNPKIVQAASSAGVTLVDSYGNIAADWSSLSTDGLHPTSEGARRIAQGFAGPLKRIIASRQQEAPSSDSSDDGGGSSSADEASSGSAGEASSSGGSGCFIATAAYGTALQPQVVLLKKFRDLRLLSNAPGQAFVQLYYKHSPPVARFIARHDAARLTVRAALLPLLAAAWLSVEASATQQAAALLASLALLAAAWRHHRQEKRKR